MAGRRCSRLSPPGQPSIEAEVPRSDSEGEWSPQPRREGHGEDEGHIEGMHDRRHGEVHYAIPDTTLPPHAPLVPKLITP